MKFTATKILIASLFLFAIVAGTGCDKIKIPGNLAGQILNEAGQGQGYMSVSCVDMENGVEASRMTAEDGGNFFFEKIDPGTYIIKTFSMSGKEIPNDCKPIKMGSGRTITETIYLIPQDQNTHGIFLHW